MKIDELPTSHFVYISPLPDTCFLYIGPYGEKRLLYRDRDGNIDAFHLRQAISLLESGWVGVPQEIVPELLEKAYAALQEINV